MKYFLTYFLLLVSALMWGQSENELFQVYNVRDEATGAATIYVNNNYPCEHSVLIEFTALKNMEADVELPFKGVVPAGAHEFQLLTLTIKDLTKPSQLGYIAKHCDGDIYTREVDRSYVYLLPYQEGEQYPLEQGYGGKFSHYMEGRTHALDFTMKEGTPICAARAGTVIDVKEDSDKGGKTIKYMEYANYVTIYHGDGSFANYYHLQKGGSQVQVGDEVEAGQVIGLSGNTGWSSGPHLHFQVFTYDENMDVKSLPTKFKQKDGKAVFLQKNREGYVSVH
ncbi:MAG: M23 family metallopeptidase [Flavobacteriales bacterium]|nr:M23 family metallopeptidase [Flavobacteriales bacterium]